MAKPQIKPEMSCKTGWRRALLAIVGGILLLASTTYGQRADTPPLPPTDSVSPPGQNVAASSVEGEMIAEVRVVGNKSLPLEKITPHIRTRAGRPFSLQQLQEDARSLDNMRMFVNVKTYTQRVQGGIAVIFDVLERPMLMDVKYVGNDKVTRKALEKESKVKVGDPVDPYAIEESRRTLEDFYRRKGYDKVRITLLEGDKPEDRRAVYIINEGVKQKVQIVKFVGNTIVSGGRLRTQIETSKPMLYLFKGELDRTKLEEDVKRLYAYYKGLGFFRARIGREVREFDPAQDGDPETLFSRVAREFNQFDTSNWQVVTFIIDEGPRSKIRNLSVKGNRKYTNEELLADLKLKNGEWFNQAKMEADRITMQDKYGSVGYVFAKASPEILFLEDDSAVDLVYGLEEGARYRVGKIDVAIKGEFPHTKITTVLNRMSLRPGDIVDTRELRSSERRLKASQLFETNPGTADPPRIVYNPPDTEEGDESQMAKKPKPPKNFRGQSPDPEEGTIDLVLEGTATNPQAWNRLPDSPPQPSGGLNWIPAGGQTVQNAPAYAQPQNAYGNRAPAPMQANQMAANQVAANRPVRTNEEPVVRFQYTPATGGASNAEQPTAPLPGPYDASANANNGSAAPADAASDGSIYYNNPQGAAPSYSAAGALPPPERPMGSVFLPDSPFMGGRPDGELGTRPLTLQPTATETQTGRFMFGVGVNSDAGLFGSIVVDEQNFSLFRLPRGWDDVKNFTAFRGNGERLRLEAVPGTQVQRYAATWQNPYLFDTQVGLGVSGFYYSRQFSNWFEQRIGGSVSLQYQFTPDLSASIAYRGAQINISNPTAFDVPQLNAVLGTNALHGFSISGSHNTRDSDFLPTQGHLVSAQLEQVVGTWVYPRASMDLRQHFPIYERPDQSGRHVLSLSGKVEYTGPNTPLYENIFYGGFSSLRGFAFRGVSPMYFSQNPVWQNVAVGGQFGMLASAEYMFPLTADDMLRGVVFCDTGTVEPTIRDWSNNYRVAPGFGLRITVPAMGPAPIALDFAFPLLWNPGDVHEMFSFFVGFGR